MCRGRCSIKDKSVLESQDLLECVYEFPVIDRWWIDHLFNELSVTVGVCCGHVDKHLQMLYSVSQVNHLLCGQHIQLHGISAAEGQKKTLNCSDSAEAWADLINLKTDLLQFVQNHLTIFLSNHDNLQLVVVLTFQLRDIRIG